MSAKAIIKKEKKKIAYKPKRKRGFDSMVHADEMSSPTDRKNPAEFKAECNKEHSRRSAMERYGMDEDTLNTAVELIEDAIRTGSTSLVKLIDYGHSIKVSSSAVLCRNDHRGKSRALWAVSLYPGEWIPIVYDNATKSPVSVLPSGALQDFDHILRNTNQ